MKKVWKTISMQESISQGQVKVNNPKKLMDLLVVRSFVGEMYVKKQKIRWTGQFSPIHSPLKAVSQRRKKEMLATYN